MNWKVSGRSQARCALDSPDETPYNGYEYGIEQAFGRAMKLTLHRLRVFLLVLRFQLYDDPRIIRWLYEHIRQHRARATESSLRFVDSI